SFPCEVTSNRQVGGTIPAGRTKRFNELAASPHWEIPSTLPIVRVSVRVDCTPDVVHINQHLPSSESCSCGKRSLSRGWMWKGPTWGREMLDVRAWRSSDTKGLGLPW